MKKSLLLMLLVSSAAFSAAARSGPEEILKSRLDACLRQSLYHQVSTGIAVYDLTQGRYLYACNI